MTGYTTVLIALRALRRNPTRALLTVLGIVIGIAAVITMMEIGRGSSNAIESSIAGMGVNTILVLPGAPRLPGAAARTSGSAMSLVPEDCTALAAECPSVAAVAPIVNARSKQLVAGNKNWTPNTIVGTTPEYLDIRGWKVADGRAFTAEEVEQGARVCLVGATIVKEVFDGGSPVDCEIRLGGVGFRVIGVLARKGANMMGFDEDDVVIAPWSTVRLRITGLKQGSASNTTSTASTSPGALYPATGIALYPEQADNLSTDTLLTPRFTTIDQIMLAASAPEKVNDAIAELSAVLRERHRLREDQIDDFRTRNAAEFMSMLTSTSTLMSNLLLGVALISLVVGGVGIMNIMLVSVTERTREIGLRMAVGARSRDILQQFLVESITLCLAGGILGILLGHGAALLINSQFGWPIQADWVVVTTAFLVSAGIGVIFGFYPAWKAARLDPIEALRYE